MQNIYTSVQNALARSQTVFYIVENSMRPGYYLFDIDDKPKETAVMWTQSATVCWAFETKQIARDYVEDCIPNFRILKVRKR